MFFGSFDDKFCLIEGKIESGKVVVCNKEYYGRGYDVYFKRGRLDIVVSYPVGEREIRFLYEYIKRLCKLLNITSFIKNKKVKTFDDIEECIEEDIIQEIC